MPPLEMAPCKSVPRQQELPLLLHAAHAQFPSRAGPPPTLMAQNCPHPTHARAAPCSSDVLTTWWEAAQPAQRAYLMMALAKDTYPKSENLGAPDGCVRARLASAPTRVRRLGVLLNTLEWLQARGLHCACSRAQCARASCCGVSPPPRRHASYRGKRWPCAPAPQ